MECIFESILLSVIKALECKLEGTEKVIHVCVKYYTLSPLHSIQ